MRLESKPRIVSVPPAEPNGPLFWKLTPGSMLIVSRIELPGGCLAMNSWVRTPFAFGESGICTPAMPLVGRAAVTTTSPWSISTEPGDCAKAAAGIIIAAKATPVNNLVFISFHHQERLGRRFVRRAALVSPHHERASAPKISRLDDSQLLKAFINKR